jgi:nitrogen fixation protein NifB
VGILRESNLSNVMDKLKECAGLPEIHDDTQPHVAVTNLEGVLVNQKLGKARELFIYGKPDEKITLIKKRKTHEPGGGLKRWEDP